MGSKMIDGTIQQKTVTPYWFSSLPLEAHRIRTSISWLETKTSFIREVIRAYLAHLRLII